MSQLDMPINFVRLIKEHSQIRIPIIQRDYAQGRKSESQIREEFLDVLYTALISGNGCDSSSVNLDFVYGSTSDNSTSVFLPLDGQQRLTTLFLLHWYLAWKDGCMEDFRQYFVDPNKWKSRFTYQTRQSSADFFDELANFSPIESADAVQSVKEMIIEEPWYFRSWRFDTTVQSSLTMLEAVHNRFRAVRKGLFHRLLDEDQSPITFQILKLDKFNLNDDLYIKMNARGIPLTSFETFKARYTQHLDTIYTIDSRNFDLNGHSVSAAEYFARRMDTKWADFFWHHRDKKTNLYDNSAINLFRTVAMVTRDPTDSETFIRSLQDFRDRRISSTYSNFDRSDWLDRNLAEGLFMLLDLWSSNNDNNFAQQLPTTEYFDEVKMFESLVKNPISLSYFEIVQLTGYVLYLQEHVNHVDCEEFQRWMRVVFNLAVNDVYDRPDDVRRSVAGLKYIVCRIGFENGETLNYLTNPENEIFGFSEQQIREERIKATLILQSDCWAELIYQAEGHGYFRGQIGFLLNFCGIFGNDQNIEQDEKSSLESQDRFKRYFELAKAMFDNSGLINMGDCRWERALLTVGDYLLPRRLNHSFLVNDRGDVSSWKRLLRDDTSQRHVLHELWDCLVEEGDVRDQLDGIINSRQVLDLWRQEFVNSPEAIKYCHMRSIRRDVNTGVVYLLRSTQMNGRNVELFTYCLSVRMKDTILLSNFPNWKIPDYEEVYGTYIEPGMRLTWSHQGQILQFKLEHDGKNFVLSSTKKPLQENSPELFEFLKNDVNFEEVDSRLQKVVRYSEVKRSLKQFIRQLDNFGARNHPRTLPPC